MLFCTPKVECLSTDEGFKKEEMLSYSWHRWPEIPAKKRIFFEVTFSLHMKSPLYPRAIYQNCLNSPLDKFLHYKSGPTDKTENKTLYLDKESSNVKIIVYEEAPDNDASGGFATKTFDCHKTVLSNKSEVFKAMFADNSMVESSSGEVKITDVPADVMDFLLRYIYFDDVAKENITCDLLMAAEKYNVETLVKICVKHLAENLTNENVMNVMIAGYMCNKRLLLESASRFAFENRGHLVKTQDWNDLKEQNPKMAADILSEAILKLYD